MKFLLLFCALADAKLYQGVFMRKLGNGLLRPTAICFDFHNDLTLMKKNQAETTAAALEIYLHAYPSGTTAGTVHTRHNNRANILFADGRVAAVTGQELPEMWAKGGITGWIESNLVQRYRY